MCGRRLHRLHEFFCREKCTKIFKGLRNRKQSAGDVNKILKQHGDIIIGRMGVSCEPREVYVVALTISGTTDDISSLTARIGSLNDLEVKSILNKV